MVPEIIVHNANNKPRLLIASEPRRINVNGVSNSAAHVNVPSMKANEFVAKFVRSTRP